MITCRELTELVTDYLEGRLTFFQRLKFHFHVGMCRTCRAYLKQMRATRDALGKLPTEPMPPELRDEFMKRFRDWKK